MRYDDLIKFKNPHDRSFEMVYGKEIYPIQPKSIVTLPSFLAEKAMREMVMAMLSQDEFGKLLSPVFMENEFKKYIIEDGRQKEETTEKPTSYEMKVEQLVDEIQKKKSEEFGNINEEVEKTSQVELTEESLEKYTKAQLLEMFPSITLTKDNTKAEIIAEILTITV